MKCTSSKVSTHSVISSMSRRNCRGTIEYDKDHVTCKLRGVGERGTSDRIESVAIDPKSADRRDLGEAIVILKARVLQLIPDNSNQVVGALLESADFTNQISYPLFDEVSVLFTLDRHWNPNESVVDVL